jgi:energy-coupling factor transporter ATP-binding protein EcfA2
MQRKQPATATARFSGNAFPALLGIIGPKGSGKSSLATAIIRQLDKPGQGARVAFARPIKAMVRHLLEQAGVSLPTQYTDGARKEETIPDFPAGVTGRHLMQTLGTEWGRSQVDEDIWVSIGVNKACKARSEGKIAMIDDTRFPNEVKTIRWHGGTIVRVQRPGHEWGADSHKSEGAIASVIPEYVVGNSGDLDDLDTAANTLLASLELKRAAQ